MNYLKLLFLVFLSLLVTLLDVSFFSALPVAGATVVLSISMIVTWALTGKFEEFVVYSLGAIFFFAIFSSLSIWFLLFGFFLLPGLIVFLRKNYFPEPSLLIAFVYFLAFNILFFSSLLLFSGELFKAGASTVFYTSVLINSGAGFFLYSLSKTMKTRSHRERIKV